MCHNSDILSILAPSYFVDFKFSFLRSLVEVVAERESLIEALHRELEAMRTEVQQARSQASHTEDQLRLRINDLESTIAELVSVVFTCSCTVFIELLETILQALWRC